MPESNPVSIIETEEGPTIVTPELRLRFRRIGDRWTHAIDVGPTSRPGEKWPTLAEPVEWESAAEDPGRVVSPVYQEVQVQLDGAGALVLAVGQAGPHHFSASIRVTHRWRPPNRHDRHYSETCVEFDVADRCRAEVVAVECHYMVHDPPAVTHLGNSSDASSVEGFSRDWRDALVWETTTANNYDVLVRGLGDLGSPSRVALVSRMGQSWRIRVAPSKLNVSGTNRLRYVWEHTRVLERSKAEGSPFL